MRHRGVHAKEYVVVVAERGWSGHVTSISISPRCSTSAMVRWLWSWAPLAMRSPVFPAARMPFHTTEIDRPGIPLSSPALLPILEVSDHEPPRNGRGPRVRAASRRWTRRRMAARRSRPAAPRLSRLHVVRFGQAVSPTLPLICRIMEQLSADTRPARHTAMDR